MDRRDCSLPAPLFYRNIMHYLHLITTPVYVVTLIVLFREKSKIFQTYKYYLIGHVFINILSEFYVSFLMLPMTYLPHPMFRTTGWLAQWGFSGLFQFYTLAFSCSGTVGSIIEMFYFRYKTCVIYYQNYKYTKILKAQIYTYRFSIFLHVLIATVTFGPAIETQQEAHFNLYLQNAHLPPEVTCYSVIFSTPESSIFHAIVPVYTLQVIISMTASVGPILFITKFMKTALVLSEQTIKLQRMLLMSLFIQGFIHGTMLIIPTIFQMYALFFKMTEDNLALILLVSVAYHGYVSTCAMIVFTKPLRDKVFCFKGKPQRVDANVISMIQSSTT